MQGHADAQGAEGKETGPDQAEGGGMPPGDQSKQGKDEAGGEGSQDPRQGNLGGVPEYDTADEEKKKDGEGTLDHTFTLPWAAGSARESLIAHSQ
jgi:hypothetical protein